jgi:hypothetical protein
MNIYGFGESMKMSLIDFLSWRLHVFFFPIPTLAFEDDELDDKGRVVLPDS